MYNVLFKKQYRKDIEKLRKQQKDLTLLKQLIIELQQKDFTHAYKNHKLKPKSQNIWECHIGSPTSDWILVYQYQDEELILILIRTGSHSELFDSLGNKQIWNLD